AAQGGEQERTAVLEKAATAANAERTEAETQAVDARLALEKLKEGRILGLEQRARITAALIGYAGQEYTLSVASGSEPENLLCEIDAALSAAQWKRIPSPRSITVNTKCGNASLNGLSGLSVRLSEKSRHRASVEYVDAGQCSQGRRYCGRWIDRWGGCEPHCDRGD